MKEFEPREEHEEDKPIDPEIKRAKQVESLLDWCDKVGAHIWLDSNDPDGSNTKVHISLNEIAGRSRDAFGRSFLEAAIKLRKEIGMANGFQDNIRSLIRRKKRGGMEDKDIIMILEKEVEQLEGPK